MSALPLLVDTLDSIDASRARFTTPVQNPSPSYSLSVGTFLPARSSLLTLSFSRIDLDATPLEAYQLSINTRLVKKLAKKPGSVEGPEFMTTHGVHSDCYSVDTHCYFQAPATLLGKPRAHRRTPQPLRRSLAAPRAAAIGAPASLHEAQDPSRHSREAGTAAAAPRRRRPLPRDTSTATLRMLSRYAPTTNRAAKIASADPRRVGEQLPTHLHEGDYPGRVLEAQPRNARFRTTADLPYARSTVNSAGQQKPTLTMTSTPRPASASPAARGSSCP
ncbi:hypothetical protein GGG16DRAFT_108241 [Schizophyllum commune]